MTTPTGHAIRPAARTTNIRYAVRDVLALAEEAARAGREMLYLNIGDPNQFGFAPPAHMVDAVVEAIRCNENGYAPSSGIPEARDAVTRDADLRGIRSIHHVYITNGASEAIEFALTALVNPGENVLTPAPGYPLYDAILEKLSVDNRPYHLDEEQEWQPDPEEIRALVDERTRALVLINPNNPTGSTCTESTLQCMVDIAIEHDLLILSDEIYDMLLYDNARHTPTASLSDAVKIVTFNGLSKSFLVPGWRVGWGIVSGPAGELEEYCGAIRKLERARLSAQRPAQFAVKPALDIPRDHLAPALQRLQEQRDLTVERLNAMDGISCVSPRGAFYAFPSIDPALNEEEFCRRVIMETGVVIVPGSGFGQRPGSQHFRVVFLPEKDILCRAFDRMAAIASSMS